MRAAPSPASGVPIMHIFLRRYTLSVAFKASTTSLPWPGAPMARSMEMPNRHAKTESRYSAVPHLYCFPHPSVSSHSVMPAHSSPMSFSCSNSTVMCACVVAASCRDSSEKCEWKTIRRSASSICQTPARHASTAARQNVSTLLPSIDSERPLPKCSDCISREKAADSRSAKARLTAVVFAEDARVRPVVREFLEGRQIIVGMECADGAALLCQLFAGPDLGALLSGWWVGSSLARGARFRPSRELPVLRAVGKRLVDVKTNLRCIFSRSPLLRGDLVLGATRAAAEHT
eukprot:7383519-Prymnesium_polylepis.2